MIKIIIDWDRVCLFYQNIIRYLISKRSYKGYCAFLKENNIEPFPYKEFCNKLEFYKIEIAFRQYFAWCLKRDYKKAKISFKSVIFNK
jgi:hypothetical protein